MEEQTTIQRQISQPSIKLNVGMNGNRGWEIKVYGDNIDEILSSIEQTNEKMQGKFVKKEVVVD
ncbi:hypothetical protein CMI38_02710 [Candidatus Pacearchaeota archaeon]|jgi:hypothetical protein|nr:hypothetical protein [Candidatus Pacearchaeota archaeon]|tara:strand:- start:7311 stop:7502 length:192 start_codon:yes stop_codon:yes gene_type:complete